MSGLRLVRAMLILASGALFPLSAWAGNLSLAEIVKRSVAANEADWRAAPNYAFVERDVVTKRGGPAVIRTYYVLMIDGSPYNRLIAVNDRPLSAGENAEEERELKAQIAHRERETPRQRERRIIKYERERRQDHDMMKEMAAAFTFQLDGEGTVAGHQVYILNAVPNRNFVPTSRETKVLTGMRGKMWIDKTTYQWVKVIAEVTRPVEFGLFVAKVGPGTRFELEQRPVGDSGVWLPSHFSMDVNASVLGFFNEDSTDGETYSHYEPNGAVLTELIRQ